MTRLVGKSLRGVPAPHPAPPFSLFLSLVLLLLASSPSSSKRVADMFKKFSSDEVCVCGCKQFMGRRAALLVLGAAEPQALGGVRPRVWWAAVLQGSCVFQSHFSLPQEKLHRQELGMRGGVGRKVEAGRSRSRRGVMRAAAATRRAGQRCARHTDAAVGST